jgi:tryptophan 7-halogenase
MVTNYVVIGGGTAGWLTALFVKETIPYSDVTVVASSEIGILGAGEGTTHQFIDFLKIIKIDPEDIVRHARGTIKNGIKFTNWHGDGTYYYHPFWKSNTFSDAEQLCETHRVNYTLDFQKQDIDALHFDASLLAKYLENIGVSRGIKLIDDNVVDIVTDEDNYITQLKLKSNILIDTKFVFDCSGFKRLIIGNYYKSPWKSYHDLLPVNRALPFFVDNSEESNLPSYTEATAMKYGWMWRIPVQGRYGCGYVFDSKYASDEEIKKEIEDYLGHSITSPRVFDFNAGCYTQTWINNCIAIGLSSGFSEPLEATSIWVQTASLLLLPQLMKGIINRDQKQIDFYNYSVNNINQDIVNFLHYHYLSGRSDTEFWNNFKSQADVDDLMNGTSRDHYIGRESWYAVGNGLKLMNVDLGTDTLIDLDNYVTHAQYIEHVKHI